MAHDFTATSSHTINYGDIADLSGNQISIAFDVYVDNFAATFGLVNKRSAHNSQNAYSFGVRYASLDRWDLQLGNAAGTAVGAAYYASRTESASQWYHVCATYNGSASAGSRCAIYIDGSALSVTATTDADVSPANTTSDLVLGRVNNTGSLYFDGRMANVGIWSAALTAAEVTQLRRGYPVLRTRPDSLLFAPDLVRAKGDPISGVVGTGSTAVIAHPRNIRSRPRTYFIPAAAPGGGTIPIFHHHYNQMRVA